MRSLYPEIEPNRSLHEKAGDFHEIYFEESGNSSGIPVVFLHGGPGLGSSENHRRYFDPVRYRIINFDQRGCNRSSPAGEIRENTTRDLLDDMEMIREILEIEKWLVFGGSWGATLGLLYAQHYPDRVLGLILRGAFLARKRDQDWFTKDGVNRIFPDEWEKFRDFIPQNEQEGLVSAYYQRMTGDDPVMVKQAARHWAEWSGKIVTYLLDMDDYVLPDDSTSLINEIRIETHYGSHGYFIRENQVLSDIHRIPDVPVILIHGRRDLTCTMDASWALHKALPGSELNIVRLGGHLAGEPVMTDALVTATDRMAVRLD
jgi:proline iminopeptidase